ncbi:MAG: hypothetical protein ACLR23_15995 [Clostridia bacterium]
MKPAPSTQNLTDIVGYHIHLVKFDTIVSDGSANGWNNIAGARQYETLIERFYANEELNTVFFHDHLLPTATSNMECSAHSSSPAGASFSIPKPDNHSRRARKPSSKQRQAAITANLPCLSMTLPCSLIKIISH